MLTAVLILAIAGCGIGYVVVASALTDARRERLERRRDVYHAALFDELDDLDPPFGTVAGDTAAVNIADPNSRRYRWGWRWNYLQTCPICFSVWAAFGVWGIWLTGGAVWPPGPVAGADVVPVGLAGGMGAMLLTLGLMRAGLYGGGDE